MKMDKFDQRDVYANHVRIYRQLGMIYEPSSGIPKLSEIVDFGYEELFK